MYPRNAFPFLTSVCIRSPLCQTPYTAANPKDEQYGGGARRLAAENLAVGVALKEADQLLLRGRLRARQLLLLLRVPHRHAHLRRRRQRHVRGHRRAGGRAGCGVSRRQQRTL